MSLKVKIIIIYFAIAIIRGIYYQLTVSTDTSSYGIGYVVGVGLGWPIQLLSWFFN